jgi:putative transcriptional regulator
VWRRLLLTGAVTLAVVALVPQRRTPARDNLRRVQFAEQEIGVGKLLIAKPELSDPNFMNTVVLIVHYDEDNGAVCLTLNRRTNVPLSKVFPDRKGAKDDPVFEGGPVETGTAQVLLRSHEKVDKATHIFGDVYASGDKDVIEKSIAAGTNPSTFRLYVGYGGWAAGQLEREIEIGGWSVLRGKPEIVFDDEPESLWQRLQRQTETRIALVLGPRRPSIVN